MQAAASATDLSELTEAQGRPTPPEPRLRLVEGYSPANQEPCLKLVFPGPRMQLQAVIVTPERSFLLKGMFVVQLSYLEDGTVFASHRELPVHGYGPNQKAALAAFSEMFDVQWRNLVEVAETALTAGGLRRRKALVDAVAAVAEREPSS